MEGERSPPNHQTLVQVLTQLWQCLAPEDYRMLRGVSRDARNAADTFIKRFCVCDFYVPDTEHVDPPESPDQIIGTFQRFLQRGGKPQDLLLRLDDWRSAEDRARIVLGILGELASSRPSRSLESLQLQGVPLRPELCAAIAAAAPRPTCLKLLGYDMSGGGGADTPGGADATGAVAQLLRAAAPGLQRLSLGGLRTAPGWAPQLLAALRQCTALRSLTLRIALGQGVGFPFMDAVPLLESLAALPGLDTLKLRANTDNGHVLSNVRGTDVLAAPLCALTRLTRLVFEWDAPTAVMPALPHLTALTALELPETTIPATALMRLSSTAPSLAHICVLDIATTDYNLHLDIQPWNAAARALAPGIEPLQFSAGLRSLELRTTTAGLYMLTALQLPASCKRLQVQGLRVDHSHDDDEFPYFCDDDLHGAQEVAEDVLRVLALLAGRGFDGDRLRGPFTLMGVNLSEEEAVPGGLAALVSALARLHLRALSVRTKCMNDRFVELLVRELPGLEALELCLIEPSALQHLQRLPQLHALKLGFSSVGDDSGEQLAKRLMSIIKSAPRLGRLELGIHRGSRLYMPGGEAVLDAQELLTAELQRSGRDLDIMEVGV